MMKTQGQARRRRTSGAPWGAGVAVLALLAAARWSWAADARGSAGDDDSELVLTREQWERRVREAPSLERLLRLINVPDWKLWRCRLKLRPAETQGPSKVHYRSSFSSSSSSSSSRSTRFAADSYSLEILKAIDEEWQKTQCMPRETCVDVAAELGTSPSMFFKPPCVSVYRCNGCCNKEGVTCRNTTTTYTNKTILRVVPFKYGPEPVLLKVANHTECKCMEPAIIRRHLRQQRSNGLSSIRQLTPSDDSGRLCANGLIWDCMAERCVLYPSAKLEESGGGGAMADCEIDVENCDCVQSASTVFSRPGGGTPFPCALNSSVCASRRRQFDHGSCSCK